MGSKGEGDLILELYSLYSDQVYRYILLHVGDTCYAEDLTQETYIRAIKSIKSFEGNAAYRTWLFTIARNLAVDFHRKQRWTSFLPDIFLSKVKTLDSLPEEILELGEETKQIYRAIRKLKPNYQDVIFLRKLKEFSIMETAQILNWSEAKVKSTQLRALKALKIELIKEGYVHETAL